MNLLVRISTRKEWIALIAALLISLSMMYSSSYPAAEPFRVGVRYVLGIIGAPVLLVPRTISLWSENAVLRDEVVELKAREYEWRDAVLENIRLRKMLEFREQQQFRYVASEVVARDPSVNLSSILLDKGEKDGVEVGRAVVTVHGLAGVIHTTDAHRSVVQLTLDRQFAASVRVERSRVDGVIRWQGGDRLLLDDVPKNLDVKKGDRIITSGLGGMIPEGVPVGVVEEVSVGLSDIFLTVAVRPYVQFSRLEEVFVLLPDTTAVEQP